MQIDQNLLTAWGAVHKKYEKNEHIFHEGDHARYYYQILEGCVKMYNSNEFGKEFIQGIFYAGQSFGEPPIFIDKPYPASAKCVQNTIIIRISIDNFKKVLKEYPVLLEQLVSHFANRIYNKTVTAREIVYNDPEHRIIGFLNSYKEAHPSEELRILIPFTRQEIANFTGLRVETVIRTLVKMDAEHKIELIKHKLYY